MPETMLFCGDMPAKKKRLTISEAAKRLGITKAAVYDAITAGRLKAKQGKLTISALLLSLQDVENYRVDKDRQKRGKKKP